MPNTITDTIIELADNKSDIYTDCLDRLRNEQTMKTAYELCG